MQTQIQTLERLGIAAAAVTPNRHVRAANGVLAQLLGVTPEALKGLDIAEAVMSASSEHADVELSTVYRIAGPSQARWYRLDLKNVRHGFIAFLLDLGEAYRPSQETREYQIVRDRLLHDGKIGTWRFDPDAQLYYFSNELSLGHEGAGAPVPVPLLQLVQHPDDRQTDTNIRARITEEGGADNAEIRYLEADGSWTHLNVYYRSGRRLPSGLYEMLGISQNITPVAVARDEANRLSERLADALRQADYANRTKTEFLANMSHELRTPLNAILGFSEIIATAMFGPLDEKYAGYARDIHRSGQHLLELVNDVLDLAKLEAGKLDLHECDLDLPELVDACFSLVRGKAEAGRVSLTRELGTAAQRLRGDARAVKQLLLNFLSNAVKFTPEGGSVTVRTSVAADGRLCLSVADTGIGMSEAEIAIALSPFGQIDSKLARKHEGTGLGLPICKSLLELHGGELQVESRPGQGTTLRAFFPAVRVLAAA